MENHYAILSVSPQLKITKSFSWAVKSSSVAENFARAKSSPIKISKTAEHFQDYLSSPGTKISYKVRFFHEHRIIDVYAKDYVFSP